MAKTTARLDEKEKYTELFFGLVGAVGVELKLVADKIGERMGGFSYQTGYIRLSDALRDAATRKPKGVPAEYTELCSEICKMKQNSTDEYIRITKLMNMGDMLRKMTNRGEIVAQLGIVGIRNKRMEFDHTNEGAKPLARTSFVINSLKNPAEVNFLRGVYGERFFAISVYEPRERRLDSLKRKIATSRSQPHPDDSLSSASELDQRDRAELNEPLGQNVQETFALGDFFLNATGSIEGQLERFVGLVFNARPFETPTPDESAMFHAQATAYSSSSPSRQVGAVVVDDKGNTLTIGTNEVPKAFGGLYSSGDDSSYRDFEVAFDSSYEMKRNILVDIVTRLEESRLLQVSDFGSREKMVNFLMSEIPDRELLKQFIKNLRDGKANADQELLKLLVHVPKDQREQIGKLILQIEQKGVTADSYLLNLLLSALSPPMKNSLLMGITEYNRTVHAEMAALMDAALRGVSVRDGKMFVTTFPCHVCTRHIIASGIRTVVYIEPYPKSYAKDHHGDAISVEDEQKGKVWFRPFSGIAPRQFTYMFALEGVRQREDGFGRRLAASTHDAFPPVQEATESYIKREDAAVQVTDRIIKNSWQSEECR